MYWQCYLVSEKNTTKSVVTYQVVYSQCYLVIDKKQQLTDKVMYWQCYLVSEKNTYDKIRCHIPSGILRVLFGEWEKHLRQNPLSHTKWCTESAIRWLTKTLTDKVMYWWMRKTLTTNSVVTYETPEWMDISTPGSLPRTATLVTQCNHCVK